MLEMSNPPYLDHHAAPSDTSRTPTYAAVPASMTATIRNHGRKGIGLAANFPPSIK